MPKPHHEIDVSGTTFSELHGGQRWNRIKQLAKFASFALIGTGISLVALRYLIVPIFAYVYPDSRTDLLDSGIYGAYPVRKYLSTNLTSPQANVIGSDDSCANSLVLLSVGGQSVQHGGPMILDMAGDLVWSAPGQYGEASANTKIQRYAGHDYLTFWAGEKLRESGLGSYFMLNSSYDIVHTVSAVGRNLEVDLHEFKITEGGSALITVYERISEIDIATGELLFEWRSFDHLEHPALQTSSGGFVADGSFDYFHMNSIDKDSKGNYLISLRHLHALIYVEGVTGNILWTLGNDAGDCEDLSQGDATGFQWQHDARWVSKDNGIISLFDNGIAHGHRDAVYSRGLIIQLDFHNWTATLLRVYTSLDLIGSASQGNVQLISRPHEDDHVFIGWGASAAFTEHGIDGSLLCETHFGASWLFYFERVKSYRAFKTFNWKATPTAWDPEARITNDKIYVSWNGATEVAYWSLQSRSTSANVSQAAWPAHGTSEEIVPKGNGFEHAFPLHGKLEETTYRIAALNAHRKVIRYTNEIVYTRNSPKTWTVPACLLGVLLLGLFYLLNSRRSIFLMWISHIGEKEVVEYHALQHHEPA